MKLPPITAMLTTYASSQSRKRGEDYVANGAVTQVIQRGGSLFALVEGSEYDPYEVQITFNDHTIIAATCTCPYEWDGWCKHIVAVLMVCEKMPAWVEQRPPLEDIIQALTRDQLAHLVLAIAERYPKTLEHIEQTVATYQINPPKTALSNQTVATSPTATHQTSIDPNTYRQKAKNIMTGRYPSEYDYARYDDDSSSIMIRKIRTLCEQAATFTRNGDGNNALLILEVITEELIEHQTMLDDDYEDIVSFFKELGLWWTEALLMAELTTQQRKRWATRLNKWQKRLDDSGFDSEFQVAAMAAKIGWDDPVIHQVLQGDIQAWAKHYPVQQTTTTWDDSQEILRELTEARLNVLEWQGRTQEFLYLAQATGHFLRYTLMLLRHGDIAQAITTALQQFTTADQAWQLATTLYKQNEQAAALHIAERGLTLRKPHDELALWLREVAYTYGNIPLAQKAALMVFYARATFADYTVVQRLYADAWDDIRKELLAFLRKEKTISWFLMHGMSEAVAIFLHEGLIDDAIALVQYENMLYTPSETLNQVLAAAITHRPDWVIETGTKAAEKPIVAGKADKYQTAVQQLAYVKQAYQAQGNNDDWQAYVDQLKATHGRKHKLMALLQGIV